MIRVKIFRKFDDYLIQDFTLSKTDFKTFKFLFECVKDRYFKVEEL